MKKSTAQSKASETDWRDGFLFVGNNVCLDFINTRPEIDGQPQELLPDWSALMRWFRAAGLIERREALAFERKWAESSEAARTIKAMRELREELRTDVRAWERGGRVRAKTLRELNDLMSQHPMLTKVGPNSGRLVAERWFPLQEPDSLFAPLADAAAKLFSQVNASRVRRCANCVLHFHDTSKIGIRRWCSMRLCGNREKVAAYAARHRSSE
ncbi:MAG: ABATE domain-containing protein [Acidobacteria bacterium]|nr:ABATE domain-containing protein [Acidobacteriota bacterium]